MIKRGNHQSSKPSENLNALKNCFQKEISHGWSIPVQPSILTNIKGTSVVPLGIVSQWSINEEGNKFIKRRTTHDCTFPGPSGSSINNRVITELLQSY